MSYVRNSVSVATVRRVYGNVIVELSIDNGSTYPYTTNASFDCGVWQEENPDRVVSIPVTIPDVVATQCYFRYTSLDITGMVWLSGMFQIVNQTNLQITKLNNFENISQYIDAGVSIQFVNNENKNINIDYIQLDTAGYVNIYGAGYEANQSKSIYLIAGRWHKLRGIHCILPNGTDKSIGIHVK